MNQYTSAIMAAVLLVAALHAVVAAIRTDLPWRRWRVAAMLVCRLALLGAVAAWWFDVPLRLPRPADHVELLVLADESASIGPEGQEIVRRWTEQARAAAADRGDWIAVRTLGGEGGRASPLAESLRDARLAFPGRAAKRLLLLSDGAATTGDPLAEVPQLQRDAVQVHAVCVPRLSGESLVADFRAPATAWHSVPATVEAVLQTDTAGPCRLRLDIDGKESARQSVALRPGRTAVAMPVVFERDGLHAVELRAEFSQDRLDWNNRAAAVVDVPLAPRIVLVSEAPAAAHPLRAALEANGLVARVVAPKDLPARLAADCIVLDNVRAQSLGDARLAALDEYARAGGAVLFSGGRRAYASGGYRNTPLEAAFPVHLDPNKEYPPFALVVVLDNSWSMNEAVTASVGKIDLAKEIAVAAVEGLSEGDWLALVSFDSEYHNIIAPTKVKNLAPAKYEISRIGAFGMTNILGGLMEAARILRGIDAAYKHIVLISDGRETEVGTDYSLLLKSLEQMHVSLSTIGVGTNVNAKLLNTLAYARKGRYYHANSLKEIPAVALQEAKGPENQLTVEMPLVPKKLGDDLSLAGIDVAALPPLAGYNRARPRLFAWTPLVISPKQEPLLARMRYGRGQTAAFLSSATPPWADRWIREKPGEYVRFWRQLVLSLLPSPGGPLHMSMSYQDGQPVFMPALECADKSPHSKGITMTRLAGGKLDTRPAGPGPLGVTPETDALLVRCQGNQLAAFSWSRTYGREFADPAQGEAMLKTLCAETGGRFQPTLEEVLAGGGARGSFAVDCGAWLAAAVLLLVLEILLRRLPAVKALLRRGAAAAALLAVCVAALLQAGEARAMDVRQQGTRLIVSGTNFRYTWDTRRGGELAAVEQPGPPDGWWTRGTPGYVGSPWQRVSSTFAWKSLDTIPALSFSSKRMSYYSGEATVAYANADRGARLKLVRQSSEEVLFETESRPKILENTRLPVPWQVKQRVRVFDSGVVLVRFEIVLPAGESYELDWASASVNLDDSLYKDPSPARQARFEAGCTLPGQPQGYSATWKGVFDDRKHLPLDIDILPEHSTVVGKPLLFGWAAYDRSHQRGSATCGYAECCLAEAKSLVGTKEDFGAQVMVRPTSGMSPVPTERRVDAGPALFRRELEPVSRRNPRADRAAPLREHAGPGGGRTEAVVAARRGPRRPQCALGRPRVLRASAAPFSRRSPCHGRRRLRYAASRPALAGTPGRNGRRRGCRPCGGHAGRRHGRSERYPHAAERRRLVRPLVPKGPRRTASHYRQLPRHHLARGTDRGPGRDARNRPRRPLPRQRRGGGRVHEGPAGDRRAARLPHRRSGDVRPELALPGRVRSPCIRADRRLSLDLAPGSLSPPLAGRLRLCTHRRGHVAPLDRPGGHARRHALGRLAPQGPAASGLVAIVPPLAAGGCTGRVGPAGHRAAIHHERRSRSRHALRRRPGQGPAPAGGRKRRFAAGPLCDSPARRQDAGRPGRAGPRRPAGRRGLLRLAGQGV